MEVEVKTDRTIQQPIFINDLCEKSGFDRSKQMESIRKYIDDTPAEKLLPKAIYTGLEDKQKEELLAYTEFYKWQLTDREHCELTDLSLNLAQSSPDMAVLDISFSLDMSFLREGFDQWLEDRNNKKYNIDAIHIDSVDRTSGYFQISEIVQKDKWSWPDQRFFMADVEILKGHIVLKPKFDSSISYSRYCKYSSEKIKDLFIYNFPGALEQVEEAFLKKLEKESCAAASLGEESCKIAPVEEIIEDASFKEDESEKKD